MVKHIFGGPREKAVGMSRSSVYLDILIQHLAEGGVFFWFAFVFAPKTQVSWLAASLSDYALLQFFAQSQAGTK